MSTVETVSLRTFQPVTKTFECKAGSKVRLGKANANGEHVLHYQTPDRKLASVVIKHDRTVRVRVSHKSGDKVTLVLSTHMDSASATLTYR